MWSRLTWVAPDITSNNKLQEFVQNTIAKLKIKPHTIIMYRDGVGDSQLEAVVRHLAEIKQLTSSETNGSTPGEDGKQRIECDLCDCTKENQHPLLDEDGRRRRQESSAWCARRYGLECLGLRRLLLDPYRVFVKYREACPLHHLGEEHCGAQEGVATVDL